ncbi:hypothetical protein Q9R23_07295 [Exiguobacterium sp. BRG2]|uniref:hypothetical protein n=1 Tax=Exiguobacterium sp. BRG2 TaxID=2962584 RepID=UPI002882D1ED|nr:hypothetical protein [Exiguobacterium sp. BRG2]MDT0172772.1 hypothetical protein [Exiguobacterium sp. BRG2]
MKIAYYISDYGYGHATRSIAIIRELLKRNSEIMITICHSFATELLINSFDDNRVTLRVIPTDVGYILNLDTLELDSEKMKKMYEEYLYFRPQKIKKEINFLKHNQISCVITDIYSIAIEAANELNIVSIGISNFLWSEVYGNIIEESKLEVMKDAYKKMTYYFQLEGSVNASKTYNFFSRKINVREVERIRADLNISSKDTVIFYGLGMRVDHSHQLSNKSPLWSTENCKFIVSSHVDISHPNVHKIPKDYIETQNYVAVSDFTITKPGWSTVGEALCGESRIILVNRASFNEDQATINKLKKSNHCKVLTINELLLLNISKETINQLNELIQLRSIGNEIDSLMNDLQKKLDEVK